MLPYWRNFFQAAKLCIQPLDGCWFWTCTLSFCTCVISVLSSNHHLLTTSRVMLRRNWSQFLKSLMYQSLLKTKLKRWWKHSVKKIFTPYGKEQKMRIVDAVSLNESKVTLLTWIYRSVQPIFKNYVMLFQRDRPMMHEPNYDQID